MLEGFMFGGILILIFIVVFQYKIICDFRDDKICQITEKMAICRENSNMRAKIMMQEIFMKENNGKTNSKR